MKTKLLLTLALLLSFATQAQTTAIPDSAFEQELIDLGLDNVIDGQVLTANINTVTSLNINNIAIANLTGIQDFNALENLYARNTNIVNLDLSNNTNLQYLSINTLSTSYETINVSNTNVSSMVLITPNLSSINVTNAVMLTSLNIINSSISTLDVSSNTNLSSLNVNNSSISTLDVSSNANLSTLNASNTSISTLDVSSNTNLSTLNASNTSLSTLNVNNTAISTLDLSNTPISSLTINNLSSTALTILSTDLLYLDLSSSISLSSIDVSSIPNISTLVVSNTNISTLDLSHTNLSTLDVSSNTNLSTLDVSNTNLSTLDVSSNTNLSTLDASSINSLTALNIQGLNLTELLVDNTNITSLDVGLHSNLTRLYVNSNTSITELNIQNGFNSNLGNSDFSSFGTPNLPCIQVDDVAYSNANWINKDAANSFSTGCFLTQLNLAFCGITVTTFDEIFTCEVVSGATQYDFQFTNQATGIVTNNTSTNATNSLALATLSDFGATYDVRVRATVNGIVMSYGASCSLTAPNSCEFPVTFTAPADVCLNADTQTGLSGGTPAVTILSTTITLNISYDVFGFSSFVGGDIVFDDSGAMLSTNVTANNGASGSTANLVNATALGDTITLTFDNGQTPNIVADTTIVGASGTINFTSGTDFTVGGDVLNYISGNATASTDLLGTRLYTGPGITNDANGITYSFNPAIAGVGIHTITYTDANSCIDTATDTVEVFALPVITFIAPDDVCVNAGVQTGLGNATPSGGIYTGPGVTDDGNGMTYSFDPTIAGIGTHTITYEFTDANGCSTTASNTIEVTAIDDPSFSYDASVYTGDDADPTPTITGLAGGTFSTDTGLVLNSTTGTIDVSTTTPGTYEVTYTTAGNCMDSSSVMVTVNVGVLTQLDPAFCGTTLVTFDQLFTCEVVPGATQYDFQITNQATSMVTISSNTEASNSLALANLFDFGATYDVRVRATVDGVTGPYGAAVCLLTAPNGCALPVTLTTPPEICIDAGIQVLSGGTTAGGVYSGPGVTDDGNGMTYSFDPVVAGLGTHTITYSVTDAIGCTNTATNTIAVVLDTVVAAFTAPADICVDSGVQTDLTGGTPEGEVTTTTVFFSNDFVDPNGFTGYLSAAGAGIIFDSSGALLFPPNGAFFRDNTQNIEYDLVDASASGSEILLDFGEFGFGNVILDRVVLEAPDISSISSGAELAVAIISATIVINGVSYVLDGMNVAASFNQSTGAGSSVYSGPGVTHDPFTMTYDFDPAVAGVGTHTITYTYTAPNGCSDTATDTIEVFDVPTVTFTAPGDLLLDAGVQSGLGGGTPIGSLARTTIVFDNVVFERPNFPDGIINGTSVVDASGTLISTNVTFFHPSVSQIPGPLENLSVTGSEISLDFGTSSNGNFIRTGTITAVGPVLGTTGVVNTSGGALTYNDFIFSLAPNTVFTATSVNSGVYSGPGVTDDGNGMTYSFDPAIAGVGTHIISYTYANANGCSNSASDTVVVFIDACQDIATYDAAGWGAIMPSINNEVIIYADYDTSLTGLGSFEACKVTVNAGATLTIAADDFIFVYGDITVETGASLIVAHTGSVVQVDDAAIVTNNGTINVNVTTPTLQARDFMIAGSPMSTETREGVYANAYRMHKHSTLDFFPHPDVDAYYAPATVANFADDNFNNWTPQTGLLNPGEGYLVSPQSNGTESGMTYDLTFEQGTLNNGEVTFGLDFHVDQNSSPSILSNPYASAIDAEKFIMVNPEINEVYFWEHLTAPDSDLPGANTVNYSMQDISIYNLSGGIGAGTAATNGGTTPNGFIATSQGFGVKATAAGTATFNNAMRVTAGNNTLRTTEAQRDRIWLTLESATYGIASETLIAFTDIATADFDAGYDSEQIAKFVSLYSHIENENSLLGIQTREALTEEKEVSLGFSTQNEEVDVYKISIKQLEGLLIENYTVYLEDHELGAITDLSKTDYTFTASEGVYNNRFTLRFTDSNVLDISEVSLSAVSVSPNPADGQLTIQSPDSAIQHIIIRDVQGRIVKAIKKIALGSYTVDISEMSSAVYFISVETEAGNITKQVIKK